MPEVVNVLLYPGLSQFAAILSLATCVCANHACVSPAAVTGCVSSMTFDLCGRVADVTV